MNMRIDTVPIHYPDSDGKPMAENTLQAEWIVTIHGNLAILFKDNPNVFVAMDNFIYPVLGDNTICTAPDVYVAFGRPKGHRGSYKVWQEDNIFPQVVFEILSPGNRRKEMRLKRTFYEQYGVEEYYVYDPDRNTFEAWIRVSGELILQKSIPVSTSKRLGIRFDLSGEKLVIYGPGNEPFLTFVERDELQQNRTNTEKKRAIAEKMRADSEKNRANIEKNRANIEKQRADTLAAKLRALGVDPDTL